jgi:hypothetical protein
MLAKDLRPGVLGIGEHDRDELRSRVIRIDAVGSLCLTVGHGTLDDVDRVLPRQSRKKQKQDDAADPAADRQSQTHPSTVLDVAAALAPLPFHRVFLRCWCNADPKPTRTFAL